MTWATVTITGKTSTTHYYMGTTSLCLNASLINDSCTVKHATDSNKHCTECKTVLKSKKIHENPNQ